MLLKAVDSAILPFCHNLLIHGGIVTESWHNMCQARKMYKQVAWTLLIDKRIWHTSSSFQQSHSSKRQAWLDGWIGVYQVAICEVIICSISSTRSSLLQRQEMSWVRSSEITCMHHQSWNDYYAFQEPTRLITYAWTEGTNFPGNSLGWRQLRNEITEADFLTRLNTHFVNRKEVFRQHGRT